MTPPDPPLASVCLVRTRQTFELRIASTHAEAETGRLHITD